MTIEAPKRTIFAMSHWSRIPTIGDVGLSDAAHHFSDESCQPQVTSRS